MAKPKPHGGKRTGAGRPKKYEESQIITIRVPVSIVAAADALATERGVDRSDVLVAILLRAKELKKLSLSR